MGAPLVRLPSVRACSMRTLALLAAAALALAPRAAAGPALGEEPIKPLPLSLHQDPARAAIGQRLFADTRLSGNRQLACASCHDLARNGADTRARSAGIKGRLTSLNTPTVFNAAFNFKQFWDGRADTLEHQIEIVVADPVEMGGHWPEVVARIGADPAYRRAFGAAYRAGVTQATIVDALASFERTLITPASRFDRYLRGDARAISSAEKAGYAKFKQYGCVACHQGVNVGGNMFQKFGVMGALPPGAGAPGRFGVTGLAEDRQVFKVPSLRNVAETAPYFHDASAPTLDAAVDAMFTYQLGRRGSKDDKAAIILFLRTLSGKPGTAP
ncbi:cytochrome-c peroxidase [Massilia rubra]|nr:cytochrome c peroxidase [Massilia rubra]